MNYDETIKLAYGIGCVATLQQAGADPVEFCKTAAELKDPDLLKMADAIAAVYNYAGGEPQHVQYAEKVASVVFEKTAEAKSDVAEGVWEGLKKLPQYFGEGRAVGRGAAEYMPGAVEAMTPMQRAMGGAGQFVGEHPLAAAGIGAGALALPAAGVGYGLSRATEEDPWYQRAVSGLSDIFGG